MPQPQPPPLPQPQPPPLPQPPPPVHPGRRPPFVCRPSCPFSAAGAPLLPTMSAPADLAAVPGLVQRLRSGRKVEQLRAAKALYRIAVAGGEPCQRAIAAAGALPIQIKLLGSGTAALREAAVTALAYTVLRHQDLQQAFLGAGGLPPLLACFEGGSEPVWAAAADCVSNLMLVSDPTGDAVRVEVASSSAVLAFVRLLGSEDAAVQRTGALVR